VQEEEGVEAESVKGLWIVWFSGKNFGEDFGDEDR
jgi:hypothetical protein